MVSYICNRDRPACREACGDNPMYECSHTSDIDYAKNWDREPTEEELREFFVRYGQHIADPDWFEREVKRDE